MEKDQLQKLLQQDESATLEFKEEPYWIDDREQNKKERQRDELIKDILALANGNSIVAGELAYLIIGAANKKNKDGFRPLRDIENNALTSLRILEIVNAACSPKLEDLDSEVIDLDGTRLNVVTINPSPHLFETTRALKPSTTKGSFTEYVVFVRHNESIRVASGKERDAIAKLKRLRFNETINPPAEPFGAIVGGIIGAISFAATAEKVLGKQKGATAGGAIAGALFGGSMGFVMGNTFKNTIEIKKDWQRSTPERNFIASAVAAFVMLIAGVILRFFSRKWRQKKELKTAEQVLNKY